MTDQSLAPHPRGGLGTVNFYNGVAMLRVMLLNQIPNVVSGKDIMSGSSSSWHVTELRGWGALDVSLECAGRTLSEETEAWAALSPKAGQFRDAPTRGRAGHGGALSMLLLHTLGCGSGFIRGNAVWEEFVYLNLSEKDVRTLGYGHII